MIIIFQCFIFAQIIDFGFSLLQLIEAALSNIHNQYFEQRWMHSSVKPQFCYLCKRDNFDFDIVNYPFRMVMCPVIPFMGLHFTTY